MATDAASEGGAVRRIMHFEQIPNAGWEPGAAIMDLAASQGCLNVRFHPEGVRRRPSANPAISSNAAPAMVDPTSRALRLEPANAFYYYDETDDEPNIIVVSYELTTGDMYWHYLSPASAGDYQFGAAARLPSTGSDNVVATPTMLPPENGGWISAAQFESNMYFGGGTPEDSSTDYMQARRWDGADLDVLDFQTTDYADDFDSPTTDKFPTAKFVAVFKEHMFIASPQIPHTSGTIDENQVRWSHPADPESWHSDDYFPVGDTNDPITGLFALRDVLVITKANEMWGVYGTDRNTWQLTKLAPTRGIAFPFNAVVADGVLWFWSPEEGLFSFNGSEFDWVFREKYQRIGQAQEVRYSETFSDVVSTTRTALGGRVGIENVRLGFADSLLYVTMPSLGPLENQSYTTTGLNLYDQVIGRNLTYDPKTRALSWAAYPLPQWSTALGSVVSWHSWFGDWGPDFVAAAHNPGTLSTWENETAETDLTGTNTPNYAEFFADGSGDPTFWDPPWGVTLDGSTDVLSLASFTADPDYTSGVTWVMIADLEAVGNGRLFGEVTGTTRNVLKIAGGNWEVYSGSQNTSTEAATTGLHLFELHCGGAAGSSVVLRVDGKTVINDTNATEEMNDLSIEFGNGQSTLFFFGIYEGALTATERARIEAVAHQRFSVPLDATAAGYGGPGPGVEYSAVWPVLDIPTKESGSAAIGFPLVHQIATAADNAPCDPMYLGERNIADWDLDLDYGVDFSLVFNDKTGEYTQAGIWVPNYWTSPWIHLDEEWVQHRWGQLEFFFRSLLATDNYVPANLVPGEIGSAGLELADGGVGGGMRVQVWSDFTFDQKVTEVIDILTKDGTLGESFVSRMDGRIGMAGAIAFTMLGLHAGDSPDTTVTQNLPASIRWDLHHWQVNAIRRRKWVM
jgi:hypothetical protein